MRMLFTLNLPHPVWNVKNMTDLVKAAGVLIKERKFLVVRQKDRDVYIAPGGKLIDNESPIDALIRELQEELRISVNKDDLEALGEFSAIATGTVDKTIQMFVYIVRKWSGEIEINQEDKVCEFRWINSSDLGRIKLGSIFEHEVFPKLKEMDLID